MSKPTRFPAEQAIGKRYACGRDRNAQIQDIKNHGSHGASPVLRAGALSAHDIVNPREQAANGIFFGCYRPFTTPYSLQAALGCLDLLGVEYTFFDKEYCCGLPLLMQADGESRDAVLSACREFARQNVELAKSKGASTLAYCCVGCAYTAKNADPDRQDRHVYILDLIADHLPPAPIKSAPATIGYFEGCHIFYRTQFPGLDLNWPKYRAMLDRFEGLNVVDLPNTLCCKHSAAKIIEQAKERGIKTLACACPGCSAVLREAGRGSVRLTTLTEVLLAELQSAG